MNNAEKLAIFKRRIDKLNKLQEARDKERAEFYERVLKALKSYEKGR